MKVPYRIVQTSEVEYASTAFFTIKINPKYANSVPLITHEKVHVKQFWYAMPIYCTLLFLVHPLLTLIGIPGHGLLYRFIPKYRLWSEVQAYRAQLTVTDYDASEQCAQFLTRDYGLNISYEKALALLTRK